MVIIKYLDYNQIKDSQITGLKNIFQNKLFFNKKSKSDNFNLIVKLDYLKDCINNKFKTN